LIFGHAEDAARCFSARLWGSSVESELRECPANERAASSGRENGGEVRPAFVGQDVRDVSETTVGSLTCRREVSVEDAGFEGVCWCLPASVVL